MAVKGELYLDNATLISTYDVVKSYETTVQDAFYSQYKTAYKLSKSNNFRGSAADVFKSYITNGAVNFITEFLDISSDMTFFSQLFAEAFYQYEKTHSGIVDEGALDYIGGILNNKENVYSQAVEEINETMRKAAEYINVTDLSLHFVNEGYTGVRNTVKKIRDDMYALDDEVLKSANELLERIKALNLMIVKMSDYCYDKNGKINADNLPKITSQGWFSNAGNVTLYLLLQEDPFVYEAGSTTLKEDQWAKGFCSDIYAYAGYSVLSASGEVGFEDGTAFAKGKAAAVKANGYAQFTDYLNGQAEVKVLYAEGEAKVGFSDKYVGFKVDAEVGVAKVDGSVVLGTEDLNAFIKGEAKFCCADGKVAFEFEEDGEFAIGFDGSAEFASAGVKGGLSFLNYEYKDKDSATQKEEKPLLGFGVGAKAKAGAGAAAWIESKTALEGEHVNINATTVKLDLEFLIGVEVDVTFPTPYFKTQY